MCDLPASTFQLLGLWVYTVTLGFMPAVLGTKPRVSCMPCEHAAADPELPVLFAHL